MSSTLTSHVAATLLVLTAAACRPTPQQACEEYVAAMTACIEQAHDDPQRRDELVGALEDCETYEDSDRDALAYLFECQREQVEEGDCSDEQGYDEVAASVGRCTLL